VKDCLFALVLIVTVIVANACMFVLERLQWLVAKLTKE
jgi:hypothetical protein